jgi:hypothetical protein
MTCVRWYLHIGILLVTQMKSIHKLSWRARLESNVRRANSSNQRIQRTKRSDGLSSVDCTIITTSLDAEIATFTAQPARYAHL